MEFKFESRNVLYGLAIFIFYALALSYLRVSLSSAFLSYRIDALLFPVLLVSLILPVFGTKGVRRLLPVIVYALFASPLIFMPLLNLNASFANLNASLAYGFVKMLGVPVSSAGVTIFAGSGASIAISTTCVSIGTFLALLMFLLPLAYLYEGEIGRKVLWLVSGIALILLLNMLRMLAVVLIWVYYGIGSAANTFHAFAGQLLFYLVIIVMLLVAGKYGLGLEKEARGAAKDMAEFYKAKEPHIYAAVAVILLFAVASLFLNSGYGNGLYAPPALFGNASQINRVMLNQRIISSLRSSGENVTELGTAPIGYIFAVSNNVTDVNDSTYVVANVVYSPLPSYSLPSFIPLGAAHSYVLRNGITVTAQSAMSDNGLFDLNYFYVSYNISGSWVSVSYLMFGQINSSSVPYCSALRNSASSQQLADTYIYNLFSSQNYSTNGFMCESYNVASSAG